jgi:hypothetical protein
MQLDLFDEVFAPNARIQLEAGLFEGPAAYRAKCLHVLPGLDATHHLMASPSIRVHGDRATAVTYYQAQHVKNDLAPEPFFLVAGYNQDELGRIDGRWYITKRTGTPVWLEGNPKVVGFDVAVGGRRPAVVVEL